MSTPSDLASDDERARAVAQIAARLGSEREARWIVDHVGPGGAEALADRRQSGEPLQYVLGRWPFRSVDLRVDGRVLIPRPETEQVVEVALSELALLDQWDEGAARGRSGGEGAARGGAGGEGADRGRAGGEGADPPGADRTRGPERLCVDLGTGSGAIALALASEGGAAHPGLQVWATDNSADALELARENVCDLAVTDWAAAERVRVVEGSWFDALPPEILGQVDLVVSNPPYVGESEFPLLDESVRLWEPVEALVAPAGTEGVEGMAFIETIVSTAPRWLRRPGALVVEIDPRQAAPSMDAARRAGFDDFRTEPDLAGRLRVLVARC